MVNLSLEHGNSDGSCFAYVWLGMILGPHFAEYQAGFRFGRLGYDLVEKRGLHRYQARAYMSFGNLVMPWTRHIQTGRDLVRRAFDAANRAGDLTFAAYSCNNLNTNLLATGDPLGEVQREAEHGLEFARKARFGLVIDIIIAQLGLIRTLRGLTRKFGSFNEEQFDESRFENHLQSDPRLAIAECWYWIRKLQARVYANDGFSAIEAASRAQQLSGPRRPSLRWRSTTFMRHSRGRDSTMRHRPQKGRSIWRRSSRTISSSRRGRRTARRTSLTAPRCSPPRSLASRAVLSMRCTCTSRRFSRLANTASSRMRAWPTGRRAVLFGARASR